MDLSMKMKEAVHKFEELNKLATNKCGIIVHKEHQFLASTPDCLIGESCVLEVKCPYTAKDKKKSPGNEPYLYLCDETGELKFVLGGKLLTSAYIH